MKKSILVTGGARSGKSSFAEKLAKNAGDRVLYIATSIAFDDEMRRRIDKHRLERPSKWDTYEGYKKLGEVISEKSKDYDCILIDCITIMLTNLIFELQYKDIENLDIEEYERIESDIDREISRLLEAVKSSQSTTIFVTNELGSGIVPENRLSRVFRDIAGRVNQKIAEEADEVHLTVCGIPLQIK